MQSYICMLYSYIFLILFYYECVWILHNSSTHQQLSSLSARNLFRVSFSNSTHGQSHTLMSNDEHDKRQWLHWLRLAIDKHNNAQEPKEKLKHDTKGDWKRGWRWSVDIMRNSSGIDSNLGVETLVRRFAVGSCLVLTSGSSIDSNLDNSSVLYRHKKGEKWNLCLIWQLNG